MTDWELERALKALGMEPNSWRALPLLPLVSVAWADGRVQEAERVVIERLASELGVDGDGLLHVRNWLDFRPGPELVAEGQALLVALCRHEGSHPEEADLLDDVIAFSKDVARAAGGFFGVGSISQEEAEAIEAVARALGVDPQRSWVRANDATFIPHDADMENDGPPLNVVFHTEHLVDLPSRGRLHYRPRLGEERAASVVGEGLLVGRADEMDLQVQYDAQVSRRHLRVFPKDRSFYVEDLGSSTGTWVNGQRVTRRKLLGGEEIRLGNVTLFFELHG